MVTIAAPLLALVIVVAIQKASTPAPRDLLAAEVLDFRRAAGEKFEECADVECLRTASTSCAPAHFVEMFSTLEGAEVVAESFVVRYGSECAVVAFVDHTANAWGGCRLLKVNCPTLEAMRSDRRDSRVCLQVVLHQLEPCKL